MKTFKELLIEFDACEGALEFVGDKTIEESLSQSWRGDWVLWLGEKCNLDFQIMTLTKARCAKTVLHLMKDDRSINAVNVAEQFGLGNATIEELNNAAAAAYTAYAFAAITSSAATIAASDAAATIAASDAYTVSVSVSNVTTDVVTDAATINAAASYAASYAASSVISAFTDISNAAYDAATAASYAAFSFNVADASSFNVDCAANELQNQKQTSDICVELLRDLIIQKINNLLI